MAPRPAFRLLLIVVCGLLPVGAAARVGAPSTATPPPAQIPSGRLWSPPVAKLSDGLLLWGDGGLATGRGETRGPGRDRPKTELQRVTRAGDQVLACGLGRKVETYFVKHGELTCVLATRTGHTRRLAVRTGRITAVHDLRAEGGSAVALVQERGRGPALVRFDLASGQRTGRAALPKAEDRAPPVLLDDRTVGRLVRRDDGCFWVVTGLDTAAPQIPPQPLPSLAPNCGGYLDRLLVDPGNDDRVLLLLTSDEARHRRVVIATPARRAPFALGMVAGEDIGNGNTDTRFAIWGGRIYFLDLGRGRYGAYRRSDARPSRSAGSLDIDSSGVLTPDPFDRGRLTLVRRTGTGGWDSRPFPPP